MKREFSVDHQHKQSRIMNVAHVLSVSGLGHQQKTIAPSFLRNLVYDVAKEYSIVHGRNSSRHAWTRSAFSQITVVARTTTLNGHVGSTHL